jgi:hypothetical protein
MISTAELLSAAKMARGIPSNYRLAKVLGATDATLQRWNTGRGCPDDAHAAELAVMAGLDVEWVVTSMRAQREKDPTLRAIWARAAERLLMTAAHGSELPPAPPSTGGDDPDSGFGDGGPIDSSGGLLSSSDESHIMRSPTPADARLRRLAKASLGRELKKKKAH